FFMVWVWIFWTRAFSKHSPRDLYLWAFFSALALYIREDAIYFFGFGLLAFNYTALHHGFPKRWRLLSPLLIFFLLLSPWMIRNKRAVGEFLPLGALRFSRTFVVSNVQYNSQSADAPWALIDDGDGALIEKTNQWLSESEISYVEMRAAYESF